MAYLLIFFPLLMAAIASLVPSNRLRPWLLPFNSSTTSGFNHLCSG